MKNLSLFSLHVLAKQVKILKAEQYFLRRKEANLTLRVSGLWLLQVISYPLLWLFWFSFVNEKLTDSTV